MTKEPNANNLRTLEFLRNYIVTSGFSTSTKPKMIGYFLGEFTPVYEGKHEKHRWYSEFDRVVKVEDKLISFNWAMTHGDESVFDMGWEFDENYVFEVEPFEKVVVEYRVKE
jgi:hypothetical protein